ncbi:hypothetical protein EES44_24525 [Streptomyces sp. ADI96-15]|uniref:hypothetical protein n=1 Tax=Streptomyces sp. ADI96-15 TaxID=1522761 RepID=UPI000F970EB4|nr:hypothetical protein [Streptomyces sp. ADI96-15]RPK58101.1 hypothetical protein EES44_24525 [Streptomyces sp. ADI96-15]
MSPAHLHAVPDQEPEEVPGPRQRPLLAPVPAPAIVAAQPAPEPDEDDEDDVLDQDDEGADALGEHDEDDEPGECDAPRGYMTFPDLRPYADPRPLAALGPLAVEAGKTAGPPLVRAIGRLLVGLGHMLVGLGHMLVDLGRMLAWYGRGIGVLLVLLAGWLSGRFGKGSIGARFGGAAFLIYAAVQLSAQYVIAYWITLVVLVIAAALAAGGHIEVPGSKPAKKGTGKAEGKGKGAKERAAETSVGGKKAPAAKGAEASKEAPGEAARSSRMARFSWRPASPAEVPVASPAEVPVASPAEAPVASPAEAPTASPAEGDGGATEEVGEEDDGAEEETPAEAPSTPSREAVIQALHHLYRGGSGVLLTLLSDRLSTADTRALKGVLAEVEIPYRTGVRTPDGNGPGVHRADFPPLPSSPGAPQGAAVVAGQKPTPTPTTPPTTRPDPGEELDAHPTEWTREQIERGFRCVRAPERGPSASKIERWPGA